VTTTVDTLSLMTTVHWIWRWGCQPQHIRVFKVAQSSRSGFRRWSSYSPK